MSKLNKLSPFLKISSKRKKILFFIVFFSMTFITLLSILVQSAAKSYLESEINTYGEQHATYYEVTDAQASLIINHSSVKQYGVASSIGSLSKSLKLGEGKAIIGAFDKDFIQLRRIKLIKGRMPQASNEVTISRKTLELLGNNIKLNSEFILPAEYLKKNGELIEEAKSYKLVGIIEDTYRGYYNNNRNKDFYLPSIIINQTEFNRLGLLYKSSYNIVAKNESSSIDVFRDIITEIGLSEHSSYNSDVYNYTDTISISYYLLVHTNFVSGKLVLFLITFIISTALSLITIISLEFKQNKQQIALVRSLGGTTKQLAIIMSKSTFPILLKAMPLGVIVGIALSKICHEYCSKIIYLFELYTFDISTIVFVAFIGLITILGTIFLTLDFLCNVSPIRSLNRIHKAKITRYNLLKTNSKNMKFYSLYAKRDLKLNKFKSFLTTVSLSISIAVCLCLFVYINNYNYDLLDNPVKGVEVKSWFREEANALDMELSYDYHFGLDQKVVDEIKSIPGINGIIAKYFVRNSDYLLAINKNKLEGYLSILHSPISNNHYYNYGDSEKNYESLLSLGLSKDLAFLGEYHATPCVETYDDYMFSYLEEHLAIGNINLKELQDGNEIILVLPPFKANPEEYPNRFAQKIIPVYKGKHLEYEENTLKPGDVVTLVRLKPKDMNQDYYKAKANLSNMTLEQRKVKIGGIIKKAGYFQLPNGDYHTILDTPLVYVHNDAMAKWTGINQYNELTLLIRDKANDLDIEKKVREILADYNNVYIRSESNFNKWIKQSKIHGTYIHLPIILVTSIISILTIWITVANNYEIKKRQFSLLRSIGLSKKQFRKILNYQAIFYGIGASIVAVIITIFYALFIYYQFYHGLRMYTWWNLVPWSLIPMFTFASIALVCFINNAQFKKDLNKSITENLRYIE